MNGEDEIYGPIDPPQADAPATSEVEAVPGPSLADEKIARLDAELAEAKDRLLRALAETENQRQRHQRERQDAQRYAAFEFARELLNVADNLRRAIDAVPAADSTARGDVRGAGCAAAARHDRPGAAAGLCHARSAAAAGFGRHFQGGSRRRRAGTRYLK